jgi:tRNA (mo5U34)-methyltransferase
MPFSDLRRRVEEHPYWWHSIDLGHGIITPGHKPARVMAEELDALRLPDLRGKTVLDIGAWDGYFSFAAERLGASRVVALDYYTWATDPATIVWSGSNVPQRGRPSTVTRPWDPEGLPGKNGFNLARDVQTSQVESVFADLMTLDTAALGQFDVVLFLGVLYHTRYPAEMVERVASLTHEVMILETESFTVPGYEGLPLAQFFERDELEDNDSNWWSLNEPAIAGICRSSGFANVEFLAPYYQSLPSTPGLTRYRALAHATKVAQPRGVLHEGFAGKAAFADNIL